MPKPRSPASASPESFRRTRRYRSSSPGALICSPRPLRPVRLVRWVGPASALLAHPEAREPGLLDVLARPGRALGDQVLDRPVGVLHEALREQASPLDEIL